jgi:hypothetical protein
MKIRVRQPVSGPAMGPPNPLANRRDVPLRRFDGSQKSVGKARER